MTSEYEQLVETSPTLTAAWSEFRDRIDGFCQYLFADDPELLLRRGLMEEASEIAFEKQESADDKQYLAGEIGDCLFYLSHIAKVRGDVTVDIEHAQELPVFSVEEGQLTRLHDPMDKALIGLLRVCDHLNPYTDRIWINAEGAVMGPADRPSLPETIESAFVSLDELATTHGINITDAMHMTANKLDTRIREPHVIKEGLAQDTENKYLSSGRGRAVAELTAIGLREALRAEMRESAKE